MTQNVIKLIVGLGNPGAEYQYTRHNAGQWFVERLVQQYNLTLQPESRFFGATARLPSPYNQARLLIPATFMNLSGKSVATLSNFYRINPSEILVVHDEMALLPGMVKLKLGGSTAGHNGLKDIVSKLGNQSNFYRLRIGIGHPGHRDKVVPFVLTQPPQSEYHLIDLAIQQGLSQIQHLVNAEMALAMNNLNGFQSTL